MTLMTVGAYRQSRSRSFTFSDAEFFMRLEAKQNLPPAEGDGNRVGQRRNPRRAPALWRTLP